MNAQSPRDLLDPDAEALYRRVLRQMPATLEEHAGELGWSTSRAGSLLGELIRLRLVRRGPDGLLRGDDPRGSLGRLLAAEERALDERRNQLLDLRKAISAFEADYRRGLQLSGPRVPAWEEVPRAAAPAVVDELVRSAEGPLLQVTTDLRDDRGHGENLARRRRRPLATGREQLSIFPMSVLTDPGWHSFARERAREGEIQRYLADVTVEFAVFGSSAVLIDPAEEEGADYLLVRVPAVVSLITVLFGSLWQRAESVHEGDAAEQDVKVLELLALGFKDEAIARHLGMSLRTLRRRIAALMADHGVDTRFQLGLAVARRGLLDH
jgi:DNA-binding transcriptional ArsR family regulator